MFKIQARHKTGYMAKPMIVNAGSANEAVKASRLYDFADQWRFDVKEVKDHSRKQNHFQNI